MLSLCAIIRHKQKTEQNMYTFTFNLPLPANMSLQQATQFFNQFNSLVNALVIETGDEHGTDLETSTYVLDENGTPVT